MTYTGRDVRRLEDADLLRGAGRFADDLPVRRDTLHAAILRSPHAHAEILSIDAEGALALPGVDCVVIGEDARRWTRPFAVAVKTPMQHWCLAVDRVRHVGEPVAVALARDRHTAEDALERIAVRYRPLPPVVDAEKAAEPDAPLLHPEVGSNVVSDRAFRYGDPEAAFVAAAHRVSVTTRYPRNAASPLECFVVIAEYLPGEAAYEVTANFQGPFAMHPVMAMALGVPGNRLRLRTPPHSGGSFGAKHAVFPYVVLLALAARKTGRPVKWVESRLEHLIAATSATNRVTTLSAAVDRDGVVTALAWDQLEDCGAYLRAPEPATLYRMHANMTGAYRVRHLSIRNRVVLTNKTPSGLVRGFGGPQVYFALERLMQRIAATLGLDPLEVIRRNLVEAFPHRCPAGAILDSGDYRTAVDDAAERGGLAQLRHRRDRTRSEGRLYGIGFAAVVEPAISNMGYITTVLSPEERDQAGPKSGAQAAATVSLDPLGGVSVAINSVPQGQGHRTATAQIVADIFGLVPEAIRGRGGNRYRQGCLVDRRRQLFEPVCRCDRQRRASRRDPAQKPAGRHRRGAAERAAGGSRLRRRACLCGVEPREFAQLCPRRGNRPLVSRRFARAGIAGDRVLEPVCARSAQCRRRGQRLRRLRLRLRFLRGRNRP